MTLRVPSFFAAAMRASMPPAAAADVAPEAEPEEPAEPDPPPPDPQAVRDRPTVRAIPRALAAVIRLLRRTGCPPVLVRPGRPARGARVGPSRIVTEGTRSGGSTERERSVSIPPGV